MSGEALRDAALDLFAGIDATELIGNVRAHLIALYDARTSAAFGSRGPWYVTADDATRYLDRIGYTGERRILGAVFRPGSGWRRTGYVNSTIPRRHARAIPTWVWVGERESAA